jgi:hypothetical protein
MKTFLNAKKVMPEPDLTALSMRHDSTVDATRQHCQCDTTALSTM